MIEAKLAVTDSEIKAVCMAMPKLGTLNVLCVYGYWNNDKCVGGAYLTKTFPNDLVMEFYTKCPTVINAIGASFVEMFKLKKQLTARINVTNYKSLKMVKMLGFNTLYTDNTSITVEFHKENWRYNKRYNIKD